MKILLKLNAFFLNNEIKKFQPEIIHKIYYSNFLKKNKRFKKFFLSNSILLKIHEHKKACNKII